MTAIDQSKIGREIMIFIPSRGWVTGWHVLWGEADGTAYMCHNPDEHFQNRYVKADWVHFMDEQPRQAAQS